MDRFGFFIISVREHGLEDELKQHRALETLEALLQGRNHIFAQPRIRKLYTAELPF